MNKDLINDPKKAETSAEEELKKEERDLDDAAIKIQAAYRGHKSRKSMKQGDKPSAAAEKDEHVPTKEELEAEFKADDPGNWIFLSFVYPYNSFLKSIVEVVKNNNYLSLL